MDRVSKQIVRIEGQFYKAIFLDDKPFSARVLVHKGNLRSENHWRSIWHAYGDRRTPLIDHIFTRARELA